MKKIDSGMSISGETAAETQKVIKNNLSKFLYFVVCMSGNPGILGGSFVWDVYGTNRREELLDHLSDENVLYERKTAKSFNQIKREYFAKEILSKMSPEKKSALLDTLLIKVLLGEV